MQSKQQMIIKMCYKENYNIQISMKNSDLGDKLEKLVYTISAGPEFMQFVQRNKQKINEYFIKNNLYQRRYHDNLSQKQMLKTNVDRYVHAFKLAKQLGSMEMVYRKADFIFNLIGMSLNTRAFLGTIQMLGNQSQVQKWKRLVLTGQVFGSYGQTQLGHGSDVQNLQTQAYYNEKLQCFVLNSPKVTSAKYWPGTLGMVCTHTVLQAKTFVKNKYIGLQTFVLQIRDKNLQPLQGVKVGDIGPKFGYHRVDNGYLIIKDLKLPLDSMLMKYIQVTPEGIVKGQQNKSAIKYAYGSMLELRVTLPFSISFGHIISPATNLYKLYQQMGIENVPEYKEEVIQYLSVGLGLILANTSSQRLFYSFNQFMKEKNYQQADFTLSKCHIISSTFKALISWKAVQISKNICTRNNFVMFRSTGIPYAYNYVISAPTYEGDNNVLLQQTARYLLKQIQKSNDSKPKTNINNSDITNILPALRYVTQSEILRIANIIQVQGKLGIGANTTWNERLQRDIIDVARLWGNVQLLQGFVDSIQKIDQNLRQLFNKIGKVLTKNILKDTPQVYAYGFIIDESKPERQFSQQQYWAISHLQRPLFAIQQNHKFVAREGNWLKSRL